ncbi:MAG: hypothetical protein US68_C0007G0009 [Candidatus Shapirobacteria bacterium GW2011_GWE1_38_10]|uniref:Uncharacterized protein n=1 Tax=Candidatus Shapirobacteria bacterium GW2011_GWE1_38_10 TaxID=1618488 RepID=A0A0G0LC78_9BACT|nr:MAG: hypothetical protein US46_C0007G0001 [Candidatus Shapirobacteria bacterium GW2011_GWF2_37_20]KKQ50246.1 MAG: hypothetical protein US68_C0007G0009 [Candidatus Shapirobacteria bacterium GW2011_GWE1_38_10]KKQ64780.1 MAG: hypothetical protein US85_C0003G0002 [Candidatus Shapirobacteria bacterium GW2011_GWF1_38_23]
MSETQPMSDSAKAEAIKKLINKIQGMDDTNTPTVEPTAPTTPLSPIDK